MLILSCLLMFVGYVAAQKTITGVVVDDLGGPLPGVSVVIKGTTTGIATSMDGRFSLNLPVGNETLVFTLVGMKHHEEKAKDEMTVTMKEDNAMLDEVVVVAYGTQKKEALTGSVNAINAKDIVKRPVSNVASALEGMGTGIQVNSSAGQAGGEPSIRIRGVASMVGSNEPLIVLDGVTFQGAISSINPEDIENISVLKDAASAALYGSRAAAGVVLISTKRGKINQPGSLNFSIRQGFSRRGTKEYKRMGSDSFMQTAYDGYRNGLMEGSKGLSLQDATSKANTDFIPRYAKYNIYDKADNELFDVNGRLSRDAKVLSGIAGDLDWFEPFERTGYRQEYNLSGSSAGEKFTMYYSASYLDDKGYITTTGFNRITGRLAATYTPKKWLKTGVTLSGSYAKYNNTQEGGSYSSNPFYAARYIAPIYPIHLHDLNTGDYILNKEGGKQYDRGTYDGIARPQFLDKHPVWELELNSDKIKRNNTGISIFGEVSFLNDFTAGVRGNMNVWTSRRSKFDNATIGDGSGASGRLNHTNYDFKDYTFSQDK